MCDLTENGEIGRIGGNHGIRFTVFGLYLITVVFVWNFGLNF